MRSSVTEALRKDYWTAIGSTIAAHVVMLGEIGLIEEAPVATVLSAIEAVRRGDPPALGLFKLVEAFDDRIDGQVQAGTIGVARVGRGVGDIAAAAGRIVLRDRLLELAEAVDGLRSVLVDLAGKHQTTVMPAYIGGFIGQPTMLGHYLGGLIAPLGRANGRLSALYAAVNESPVGAGAMTSSGLPIDRERVSALLWFERPIPQTFDAVAAVYPFLELSGAVRGIEAAVSRYLDDLLTWIRREPESFLARNGLSGTADDVPQLRMPEELLNLAEDARAIRASADALASAASAAPYGPLLGYADRLFDRSIETVSDLTALLTSLTGFFTERFDPNRAYLANRAGKGLGTSSDIADLLMIEEQIDPGAARAIASLVTSRLIDEGLEISAITTDMIDGAALMTIGREIKVEFEAISRYLAPRRFIERRAGLGGPAPFAIRSYLVQEEARIVADRRWRADQQLRLAHYEAEIRHAFEEASKQLERG
jgi:argininosuccinate lyase